MFPSYPSPPGEMGIESNCWERKSSGEEGKGKGREEGRREGVGKKGREWKEKGKGR